MRVRISVGYGGRLPRLLSGLGQAVSIAAKVVAKSPSLAWRCSCTNRSLAGGG